MTNKEYNPLTYGKHGNTKILQKYIDRLCYLEYCIENDTLLFLPCKVGDKFWVVVGNKFVGYDVIEKTVRQINVYKTGLGVLDQNYVLYRLGEIYFNKEDAEKVAKEMEK